MYLKDKIVQKILLFSILIYSQIVCSQSIDYTLQHLSFPENIGVVKAKSLVQDTNGFLYVGLNNGLFRYDGHEVKELFFVNTQEESESIIDVKSLQLDHDGDVWVITRQNIYLYNSEMNKIRTFAVNESIGVEYRLVYITKKNEIVIGTNKGVRIYDKQTKKYESYIHSVYDKNSLSHDVIRVIHEDEKENLWIGTYNKLNKFDRKTKKFISFDLKPKEADAGRNNLILAIEALPDSNQNKLIVGTETGLVLFDKTDYSFEIFTRRNTNNAISNDVVKAICAISSDEIWFGTDFGLNKFSIVNNTITSYYHDFGNKNSISHDVVENLYKDKQDNLWVATDNGVDRFYLSNKSILFNQTDSGKKQLNESIEVNSFAEDSKGNIWIASNQGLIKYDKKKYNFIEFQPPQILHTKVSNLFINKNDNIWIATPGGINHFLSTRKTFDSYRAREGMNGYLETNYTSGAVEDKNGKLWVSTLNKGLFVLPKDKKDGNFTHFNFNFENKSRFTVINGLTYDKNNNLWISTFTELIKLNVNNSEFTIVSENENAPKNMIFNTYYDKEFWVAAVNGIFKWDQDINSFKKITELNFQVKGFVVDGENIWLTSFSNLYKYTISENVLKKIPSYLTLNVNFNNKGYKDTSGRIYFSSFEGFISFDPSQITFNQEDSNLRFTDFKVLGKSSSFDADFYNDLLVNKPINELKKIELKNNDNSFDISFSSLNLIDSKNVTYNYILDGYDNDWKVLSNGSNIAKYEKVTPGTYTFKVFTNDSYGLKNNSSREFVITVNSPFYTTDLAILIYCILVITVLIVINRVLISREQYNNKVELEKFKRMKSEELIELKTKFFSTITHELKTPLTLIKTPIERMMTEEEDKGKLKNLDLINRNANRLIKLVNQILDIRKFEKGIEKLEIQEYDIVRFCRTLFNQFEQEANHRQIHLYFESNIDALLIWFDLDKLEKVVINLLSNAYKFTPDGGDIKLRIKFNQKTSKLRISIKDSGVGIKEEDQGKVFDRFSNINSKNYTGQGGSGIGLSLVKELVNLHKGEIRFKSKENQGSTFTFTIPIQKEKFSNYVDKEVKGKAISKEELPLENKMDIEAVKKEKLPLMLLVEDEKDMRDFMTDSLQNEFSIISSNDGVEGFQNATKRIPDIIISDVMMPNMDGFEFCKKIKTDVRTSHIPVILLSAKGDAQSKLAGVKHGADDYVGKPFKLDYLVTKAKNLIEQRNSLKVSFVKQKTLEPSKISITSLDENLMRKVIDFIEENIDNHDLNVQMLSDLLKMSHVNFYRKIKGLTGQTVTEFIRTVRLKRAGQLLKSKQYNVKEVMFMVGFTHRSYFSKMFKEQFGENPKDYS